MGKMAVPSAFGSVNESNVSSCPLKVPVIENLALTIALPLAISSALTENLPMAFNLKSGIASLVTPPTKIFPPVTAKLTELDTPNFEVGTSDFVSGKLTL